MLLTELITEGEPMTAVIVILSMVAAFVAVVKLIRAGERRAARKDAESAERE